MENGPQSSLTNFGGTAGKTSSDDNRNMSLPENLSLKVFLHCRESRHPYQTFCRPEQVWPILFVYVCRKYEDIALCVDVTKVVVTSPDFAHPEIPEVLLIRSSSYSQ